MSDYTIENHGTIFLVRPQSDAARQHLLDHTPEEAQWFGDALVVEHRYAFDLATQLQTDGWEVR